MPRQNQSLLNLKRGDTAYFIAYEGAEPVRVTITGPCSSGVGSGYDIESVLVDDYEMDHTCDGSLFKTKREARQEVLRSLPEFRRIWVERQAEADRVIKYIDYIKSRKGRY